MISQGLRPEDIAAPICERTGLTWEAAKQLIIEVQARHPEAIQRRQRWLALAIGLPVFVLGLFLTIAGARGILLPTLVIVGTDIPHPLVFIAFGVGLAMMYGGWIGLSGRWKA
jgi:hypothetical protein